MLRALFFAESNSVVAKCANCTAHSADFSRQIAIGEMLLKREVSEGRLFAATFFVFAIYLSGGFGTAATAVAASSVLGSADKHRHSAQPARVSECAAVALRLLLPPGGGIERLGFSPRHISCLLRGWLTRASPAILLESPRVGLSRKRRFCRFLLIFL